MRERLIKLLYDAVTFPICQTYEGFADHLIDNGVVLLPCKVGEEVYYIIDGKIQELRVDYGTFGKIDFTMSARCKEEADMCEYSCFEGKTCRLEFDYSHIGKTVFLTRKEAERALRKEDESNGI